MSSTTDIARQTHWFTITVTGLEEWTDDLVGRMLEAGCDDATLSSSGGVHRASFARDAVTFDDAVASAATAIKGIGLAVIAVTPEEPPTPTTRLHELTVTVVVRREAESLGDAIGSAVNAIERAGFAVARVEVDGPKGE